MTKGKGTVLPVAQAEVEAAALPLPDETPIEAAPVEEPPVADEADPAPGTLAAAIEPLVAYATRMEAAALPLTVCEITHPNAVEGAVHQGTYSGIRLVRADEITALLSDGTRI